jgi:pimeloyl-ACP methyl ester carboxylesterase
VTGEAKHVSVGLADGRSLPVIVTGPADGLTLLFQTGTPGGLVEIAPLAGIAARQGFRLVMYARPGYGSSDPLPGRRVADAAPDAGAVLDSLGADRFVTAGWSGGGPHALATAALLGGRCAAAATIAGVAPYLADGLDWFAGMAQENVDEFGAATRGAAPLTAMLEEAVADRPGLSAGEVAAALGGLVTDTDAAALSGWFAEYMAESTNAALANGIAGWRDDDLAFVDDWGFTLDQIGIPVAIWHGDQDAMVPFAHGAWLARHVPGARARLVPGEGHLTLVSDRFAEIASDLHELAGQA